MTTATKALPNNWPLTRFGDVVRNVNDNVRDPLTSDLERYVGLDHLDPESLHIKRWGLIADGTTFTRRFVAGQVLFGKRRAYQRKVAVAEFDGICSGDILVFEPANDQLLPELLPFIVQSDGFFQHALGTSAGSLSPRTKWQDLARYEFALPPLDEQHRIAEILWAADEAIERHTEALSNLETCKQSVVTTLLRGQHALSPVELRTVADVAYGLTVNASRREMSIERPYLRVANVQRGYLDLSEIKSIGCTKEDIANFALRLQDILVVEGHANAEEIGRSALWNGQIDECLHQNHVLRIRCNSDLNPRYLLAFLNGPDGRSYFRRHAKSTSGLNTINSTVLKNIRVPVLPLIKQNQIVGTLERFDSSKDRLQQHLSCLRDLKNQMLSNLIN